MEVKVNELTPELFLELYRSVGWEVPCLELISTIEYEKMGFEPRPCEWDGSGMFKMIRG